MQDEQISHLRAALAEAQDNAEHANHETKLVLKLEGRLPSTLPSLSLTCTRTNTPTSHTPAFKLSGNRLIRTNWPS